MYNGSNLTYRDYIRGKTKMKEIVFYFTCKLNYRIVYCIMLHTNDHRLNNTLFFYLSKHSTDTFSRHQGSIDHEYYTSGQ